MQIVAPSVGDDAEPLQVLPPDFPYLSTLSGTAGYIVGKPLPPLIVTTDRLTGAVVPFYTPTLKQLEMHLCPAHNLLYGGRAGTGKSYGMRNDGYIRCLVQPEYRALLVRRHMTELRDTHLDKLEVEADAIGARYRASETTIVFASTRARFRFGHVEDDQALKAYLSSEFDIIYFDEGATFTEFQFRFLCSRLRTVKTGVKRGAIPMVRVGSNPGAAWLKDYFIDKDVDAERDPGYDPDRYYFIPASVEDNPHADHAEYNVRLNSLPTEALRRMYRDGDWNAVEGQFYEEWWPNNLYEWEEEDDTGTLVKRSEIIPWHVVKSLPTMPSENGGLISILDIPWIEVVRAVDWGFAEEEPGICLWFALLPDGSSIGFQEYKFHNTIPEKVAQTIREMTPRKMKVRYTVGDPHMFAHITGESIAETFAKKRNGGIGMIEGDNSFPAGFNRVHSHLKTEYMATRPYPALRFLDGSNNTTWSGCPYTIKNFPMLTKDKLDPTKIGSHQPDHGADATKYYTMSRPSLSREPQKSLAHLSPYVRKLIARGKRAGSGRLGVESMR